MENIFWHVKIVKSGFSMVRYRQPARKNNQHQNSTYYTSTLQYDDLVGVRKQFDVIYKEARKKAVNKRRGVKKYPE